MEARQYPEERPEEWLPQALVAGFIAAAAMLVATVLASAVVFGLAGVEANPSASGQQMQGWFRAAAGSALLDPARNGFSLLLAGQFILGLAGAIAYALVEPRWTGPAWTRGGAFGLLVGALGAAVLLPLAGAGILGAGPLPLLGLLLGALVYGVVLGVVYGPLGDQTLGPPTAEEVAARRQTVQTGAAGLMIGIVLGALAGVAITAWSGPEARQSFPAAGVALAAALVGGALGEAVGFLAGLPVAPSVALAAAGVARTTPVLSQRNSVTETTLAERPHLRVVGINGVCSQGYRLGDSFTCTETGVLSPPLCPVAAQALRLLMMRIVQGSPTAPERIACPIYDHMLVLELEHAA